MAVQTAVNRPLSFLTIGAPIILTTAEQEVLAAMRRLRVRGKGCIITLRYDADGSWQVFESHPVAKIKV